MLLQRARQSAAAAEAEQISSQEDNEEILTLDDVEHLCAYVLVEEACHLSPSFTDHFQNSIQGYCQLPIFNLAREEAGAAL